MSLALPLHQIFEIVFFIPSVRALERKTVFRSFFFFSWQNLCSRIVTKSSLHSVSSFFICSTSYTEYTTSWAKAAGILDLLETINCVSCQDLFHKFKYTRNRNRNLALFSQLSVSVFCFMFIYRLIKFFLLQVAPMRWEWRLALSKTFRSPHLQLKLNATKTSGLQD